MIIDPSIFVFLCALSGKKIVSLTWDTNKESKSVKNENPIISDYRRQLTRISGNTSANGPKTSENIKN